ncbi:MAG: DNA mismatch repair protein MutS [Treponema sp.]|nr:DNA mismatch repair protein MutS [Treponema sp.]
MAESTEQTPLMMQYQSIKNQYRDEVLFFRLGDFYEMFDDDAVEVSRLLNLTLTHRGAKPMCGIPFHAVKIYIARLLRLGKRIAICEQVSEPTGKGLAERKVVEVVTPGTAVESSYLEGSQNNFLACLYLQKNSVGFAFIDVTTAEFFASSWNVRDLEESFLRELGRVSPRELLLSENLRTNGTVQKILSLNPNISVSYYPDWNFKAESAFARLTEQFKTKNLKSFGLYEHSPEVPPAGFLLDYLQKTTISDIPHVSGIKVYSDNNFVIIDDSSRRNLEITQNLRDGTVQFSLLDCLSMTKTAIGKRMMRSWLSYPLKDVGEITARQNHVELFVQNRSLLEFVQEKFSSVLDIERLAGRVAMERAHAKDLQALKASLEIWSLVYERLLPYDFCRISMDEAAAVIDLIEKSILDDPSTSLTEGRLIKEGWSSELDNYRNLNDNANKILEAYVAEEIEKTGITNLRIRNNNLSGYYIEITRGKTAQVPSHFIIKRALKNVDRYTTARLQEIESELDEATARIIETERALFVDVRRKIGEHVPYLLETAHLVAYTDVVSALAQAGVTNNWVRPVVDDGLDFEVRSGRHPVVEKSLPGGEFVPNDLSISSEKGGLPSFALITGPNMAGKSTYLRQNALILVMAQIGSFVPADFAHVGVVDKIFCRVGASDNLAKGESTFLVEMTETACILREATKKSFVVMDEVGRGTSTQDGFSIAWAVSEHLLNTVGCKTLFATHYHELTRMKHERLMLLCMEVQENGSEVVFLRKIREGASGNSYGIHVAALAGIPQSVIQRAKAILSSMQGDGETQYIPAIETSTTPVEGGDSDEKSHFSKNLPGLFSDEELILDEILSVDPDEITPREALDTIARWRKLLSGR